MSTITSERLQFLGFDHAFGYWIAELEESGRKWVANHETLFSRQRNLTDASFSHDVTDQILAMWPEEHDATP